MKISPQFTRDHAAPRPTAIHAVIHASIRLRATLTSWDLPASSETLWLLTVAQSAVALRVRPEGRSQVIYKLFEPIIKVRVA